MKLVIQIPCFNEEKTLPDVIKDIPKKIKGIDEIILLVIDDGSTDNTIEVAKKLGCRVVSHKKNLGLAKAFKTGVEEALRLNADILVNTDGDNQYKGEYITNLVSNMIDKNADIVVGNRQTSKIPHFSLTKKFFQYLGSFTVRFISDCKITDTVSGFRAYSREAMLKLNVTSNFSYVLDTLIQATKKDLLLTEVIVATNPPTRKSRLFSNMFQHIKKSSTELFRVYFLYESFKTFMILSSIFFLSGLFLVLRFFFYYFQGYSGFIQSLIISSLLLGFSFLLFSIAIIGDILSKNREINEEVLYLKKREIYKN